MKKTAVTFCLLALAAASLLWGKNEIPHSNFKEIGCTHCHLLNPEDTSRDVLQKSVFRKSVV